MTIGPGATASLSVIYEFAAPTGAVALLTTATTIATAQVPAVSLGTCDIEVDWGYLSLANTATSAVSYTLSDQIGGSSASNINGITPNGYLGAASAGGSITTAYVCSFSVNVNTNSPFTVALKGLGSTASAINAYLAINNYVRVIAYVPGTV